MQFSNKTYDILKWLALIVLPAVATLYGSLAEIWGLPFANAIPETIMALNLFLGVSLGVSSAQYQRK